MPVTALRATTGTTTQTISLTKAGLGWTPNAAIVFSKREVGLDDENVLTDVIYGAALITEAASYNVNVYRRDNVSTTNVVKTQPIDAAYENPNNPGLEIGNKPAGGWFIPNGMQIDHVSDGVTDWYLGIVLMQVTNVLVDGNFLLPPALNDIVEYTASPFVPKQLIQINAGSGTLAPTGVEGVGFLSISAAHDAAGGLVQQSAAQGGQHARSGARLFSGRFNDRFASWANNNPTEYMTVLDFAPSTGNGFRLQKTQSDGESNRIHFMLLDMPDTDFELLPIATPGTTGIINYGTIDPDVAIAVQTGHTNLQWANNLQMSEAWSHGIAARDDGQQIALGQWENTGAGTTAQSHHHGLRLVDARHNTGGGGSPNANQRAEVSTWGPSGIDLNYTFATHQGLGFLILMRSVSVGPIEWPASATSTISGYASGIVVVENEAAATSTISGYASGEVIVAVTEKVAAATSTITGYAAGEVQVDPGAVTGFTIGVPGGDYATLKDFEVDYNLGNTHSPGEQVIATVISNLVETARSNFTNTDANSLELQTQFNGVKRTIRRASGVCDIWQNQAGVPITCRDLIFDGGGLGSGETVGGVVGHEAAFGCSYIFERCVFKDVQNVGNSRRAGLFYINAGVNQVNARFDNCQFYDVFSDRPQSGGDVHGAILIYGTAASSVLELNNTNIDRVNTTPAGSLITAGIVRGSGSGQLIIRNSAITRVTQDGADGISWNIGSPTVVTTATFDLLGTLTGIDETVYYDADSGNYRLADGVNVLRDAGTDLGPGNVAIDFEGFNRFLFSNRAPTDIGSIESDPNANVSAATPTISGYASGIVVVVEDVAATSIISGYALGQISVGGFLDASATSTLSGYSLGVVTSQTVVEPAATSLISGYAVGEVIPETVVEPSGTSSLSGYALGEIVLTGEASATSTISGYALGQIAVEIIASATSTISGYALGEVNVLGQEVAAGTSTISGYSSGLILVQNVITAAATSTIAGYSSGLVIPEGIITVQNVVSTISGYARGEILSSTRFLFPPERTTRIPFQDRTTYALRNGDLI